MLVSVSVLPSVCQYTASFVIKIFHILHCTFLFNQSKCTNILHWLRKHTYMYTCHFPRLNVIFQANFVISSTINICICITSNNTSLNILSVLKLPNTTSWKRSRSSERKLQFDNFIFRSATNLLYRNTYFVG